MSTENEQQGRSGEFVHREEVGKCFEKVTQSKKVDNKRAACLSV